MAYANHADLSLLTKDKEHANYADETTDTCLRETTPQLRPAGSAGWLNGLRGRGPCAWGEGGGGALCAATH